MTATAQLFEIEGDQAVRLPVEFRFGSAEVSIRRDEATGDVVLSAPGLGAEVVSKPKPDWDAIFAALDAANIPDDLWRPEDRDKTPAPERSML